MYASQRFTISVAFPVNVITGGVVSTTFTVLIISVAGLRFVSVILYVTWYEPMVVISTPFTVVIEVVIFPSSVSTAVAHASV